MHLVKVNVLKFAVLVVSACTIAHHGARTIQKRGERVHTTAKYTPHFKPGKDMRERVNANRHLYEITAGKEKDNDSDIDEETSF